MGFSVGGKNESKPSPQSRIASQFLLDAIVPGLTTGNQRGKLKGTAKKVGSFFDTLNAPIGGIVGNTVRNPDGSVNLVGDFSESVTVRGGSGGIGDSATTNPVNPGTSLLPTIQDIGNFTTLFDKFDQGRLSSTANSVISNALNIVQEPVAVDTSFINSVISNTQAGKIEDPPGLGELTTQIFNDLPPEFQEFTNNLLNDSSPEQINAELDNLTVKLQQQAKLSAKTLGGQVLASFASQGVTGGAAIEGLKSVATQVAINTNAQIAGARLNALETLVRARDQGVQVMNSLISAGASEQANIVRSRTAELEAQTAIQVAKLDAATRVQNNLIDLSKQQVALQGQQLAFQSNLLDNLFQENARAEQQRSDALQIPLQTLLALATGGGQVSKSKEPFGITLPIPGAGGGS